MAVKRLRRFAIACLFLLVVCTLMPVNTSAQGGNYNFVNIDYPGAYSTFPTAVNDSGAIVGYYLQTQLGPYHGFLYSGGVYTTIDYPEGTTFPQGINNSGVISSWPRTLSRDWGSSPEARASRRHYRKSRRAWATPPGGRVGGAVIRHSSPILQPDMQVSCIPVSQN